MAYASWLNIAAANSRNAVLFRIYDAVANLLAGSMAGTWTIIDSVGTYTSEATPADGDYLVLECQSARSGGEKLQVFVGLRTSTGNLAGFGSKVAGVWICASPVAGWNSAAGYFGASLADWRNSLITVATGGTGAVNFGLILTSGTPGVRPGSLYTLARVTTGTQTACLGAVSLIPPNGLADAASRTLCIAGGIVGTAGGGWMENSGSMGRLPNVALDTKVNGYLIQLPTHFYGLDRESGSRVQLDMMAVHESTSGLKAGMLDSIMRCDAANGDVSTDGTRWAWDGLSFPREASRDGFWI